MTVKMMINYQNLYEKLHDAGFRVTARKKLLLSVLLDNSDYLLSPSDIIGKLEPGTMDTATVYRILQSMHQAGIIESSLDSQGISRYKICDSTPHHHMICTSCGRILNFPCNEKFWGKYLEENNFKETSHSIEVFGICSECQKKSD
ncbi:MAG TPA: Fur family transcriptional regulator [Clostridia bacterium]|nr:Fur family transcriptional regulator [Clostridia bacterium]